MEHYKHLFSMPFWHLAARHPQRIAMNDFMKALNLWEDNPKLKPANIEKLSLFAAGSRLEGPGIQLT
jgi:hypothetical protein